MPPPGAPPPSEQAPVQQAPVRKEPGNEPDVPQGAAARRDAELAKRAQPVVEAFGDSDGELTPDGGRLIFRSNRNGLDTLYAADASGAAAAAAPAARLVDRDQRVASFEVTRDGRAVVFRSDRGADENFSIFRVDVDGKNLTELTPGEPMSRGPCIEPDGARGQAFFAGRKLKDAATDFYQLDLAGGSPPRKVFSTAQVANLADVARDGRTLAVVRVVSHTETLLDLVDVASGKARTLYPRPGQDGQEGKTVSIAAVRFSPDGARVLVASDGGGDRPQLVLLDRKSGKQIARWVEKTAGSWPPGACRQTRRGDRIACVVTLGERSELRVLEGRRLREALSVKMPPGTGTVSSFSDDGQRLLATWETPASPPEIFAIDMKSGAATPLRADPRPGLDELPPIEVSVAEVKAHDGLTLHANVYLPPGAKKGEKLPVIVAYHGGPADVSMLRWSPYARFFTALGYAWVQPNVRGSTGFGRAFEMADNGRRRLDALKDVETTGRWAAAQPWADPRRLVVYGGSYGGYTVLIGLTRMADLWRAGVDLFGPSDIVSLLQSTTGAARETARVETGDLDKDRDFLESISPLRDVGKIQVPLFVYAGANDPRVPRSESDQIVLALRRRGVPVEYMVADNEGHSLARRENQVAFMARAARFLEDALK